MNEGTLRCSRWSCCAVHKQRVESTWDERAIWNDALVRDLCIFTTHTPVEAGHDRFSYDIVQKVLGTEYFPLEVLKELGGPDMLNMSTLGLNLSGFHNGCGQEARRSVAQHVSGLRHSQRHQRRALAHLDT
jgi:starch phosphorylase